MLIVLIKKKKKITTYTCIFIQKSIDLQFELRSGILLDIISKHNNIVIIGSK